MMKDEIDSAEPPQWQRWTEWIENEQVPLASRERRCHKASICASRLMKDKADSSGRSDIDPRNDAGVAQL
jgi:hypothetical protein